MDGIYSNDVVMTARSGAWHGKEILFAEGFSAADAKRLAMGFTILRQPLTYTDSHGRVHTVENRHVLYRSDTGTHIGIVSNRFKVHQPVDTVAVFESLVAEFGYEFETCLTMFGGKKLCVSIRNPNGGFRLGGSDVIKDYMMITVDNTGAASSVLLRSKIRPVCNNTVTWALQEGDGIAKTRHTSMLDVDGMRAKLVASQAENDTFQAMAEEAASRTVSDRQAVDWFAELYVRRDDKGNVDNEKQLKRIVNDLMDRYKYGDGAQLSTAKGTAWGAINAVTNYVDHGARAHSEENRFVSAQFGKGAEIKRQAIGMMADYSDAPVAVSYSPDDSGSDFQRLLSM